jgi:hypothetical protein
MTNATYQKKKLETQKEIANLIATSIYGISIEDMLDISKKQDLLIELSHKNVPLYLEMREKTFH